VNADIPAEHLRRWITSLYRERLNEKMKRMHSRLQEIIARMQSTVGEPDTPYMPSPDELPFSFNTLERSAYNRRQAWEQLLYEEIMDCLGYSNNRAPMKQLAELVPLTHIRSLLTPDPDADPDSFTPAVSHIEAILFRASGLLPSIDEISDTGSKVYLHSLTAAANELRYATPLPFIHHTDWNFSPTRPANFPTIRIAAGSVVAFNILYRSLVRSIMTVIEGRHSSMQSKIGQLCALLDAGEHPFWNDHYTFSEAAHAKHSVLGRPRINDILVNAIIPFVYVYSRIFTNDHRAEQCLNIAAELPLLEENSVLQTMKSELLKGKIELSFAYQQQGLIQLFKQYCIAGRCSECSIGKEVMNK
jgi:hypothetical protein